MLLLACVYGAYLFLGIAVCLLLHHGWVHAYSEDDTARRESCVCVCYFQPSDIAHYESWILIFLSNAVTWVLGGLILLPQEQILLLTSGLWFSVLGLVFALLLWRARSLACPPLRSMTQNVSNHETWIVLALTNAASLAVIYAILQLPHAI